MNSPSSVVSSEGDSNAKYILIAGLPRSGSTLTQLIFSNNSSVFTLPETHFFEVLCSQFDTTILSYPQAVELLKAVKLKSHIASMDENSILSRWSPSDSIHADDLYFELIESFRPSADRQCRALIGLEKTPGHIYEVDRLLSDHKNINVILTTRAARDFVSSIRKTPWSPSSFSATIDLWKNYMREIVRLRRKYSSRLACIAYENLVSRPESTVETVCEKIGLDWEPDMLLDVNRNAKNTVLEFEVQWKQLNLEQEHVVNKPGSVDLNWAQRMQIFAQTLVLHLYNRFL